MTSAEEFAAFWAVYPRHIAKIAAQKAFIKARKLATFQEIVDGVGRYIHGKPSYADWAHAASWLNAGRWADEYDAPQRRLAPTNGNGEDWFDECKRLHELSCGGRYNHAIRMDVDRMKAEGA